MQIFLSIQVLLVILLQILAPNHDKLDISIKMLAEFLSTAADMVDLGDYTNNKEITNALNGVNLIYGNCFKI